MPPQAAGMTCYSATDEITPGHADYLVELRGFEPLTSAVEARGDDTAGRFMTQPLVTPTSPDSGIKPNDRLLPPSSNVWNSSARWRTAVAR
jgi:hypothetical protein